MERIKRFLERWPSLYRVIRKIYMPLGTQLDRVQMYLWRNRQGDWFYVKKPPSEDAWIQSWNSKEIGHRPLLVEKVAGFSPLSSVLEIGCGVGPNLYSLGKRFPQAAIKGIDINALAVQTGNRLLAQEGLSNVKLSVGRVEALGKIEDKSFDVVFTDAVLMLISRDEIYKVISDMVRIAHKGIVLLEWHDFDQRLNDTYGLGVFNYHWVRDYSALLKQFVPEDKIRVTRLPDGLWPGGGWGKFGAIIEVTI